MSYNKPASESEALLARLRHLHPRKIDLSLHRCARLLRALGDPQKKLARAIHIAGTNGKGSTLACLESCLQAMGLRTQAYLSPHLCRFNERIRLEGIAIADDLLARYLNHAEQANAGGEITFFEITTAAAFLAFAEHPADFLLLETGLGGRLDATNLVERKCAAVLTPIDYDHAQFLGSDLEVITGEKVAIAQGAELLISAAQRCSELIIEFAGKRKIPLYMAGRDFSLKKILTKASTKEQMTLRLHNDKLKESLLEEESGEILLPAPSAIGEHQRDNAALAATTLLALFAEEGNLHGLHCPPERLLTGLRSGIASFSQPARLQRLSPENVYENSCENPLSSFAPSLKTLLTPAPAGVAPNWEVLLDGAHNPHAARAVAKALEQHWQGQDYCLILCLMEGKDARGFTKAFEHKIARGFAYGGGDGENAEGRFMMASDLVACGHESNLELQAVASLEEAFRVLIANRASLPPRLLIAGSLYLAAEILGSIILGK